MLGAKLDLAGQQEALADFYHYFDLSNEQAFLMRQGRIRKRTWKDWQEGIAQHLSKPAFAAAWQEITSRSTSFDDLKELVPAAGRLVAPGTKSAQGKNHG